MTLLEQIDMAFEKDHQIKNKDFSKKERFVSTTLSVLFLSLFWFMVFIKNDFSLLEKIALLSVCALLFIFLGFYFIFAIKLQSPGKQELSFCLFSGDNELSDEQLLIIANAECVDNEYKYIMANELIKRGGIELDFIYSLDRKENGNGWQKDGFLAMIEFLNKKDE